MSEEEHCPGCKVRLGEVEPDSREAADSFQQEAAAATLAGKFEDAETLFKRARQIYNNLPASTSEPDAHFDTMDVAINLGSLYMRMGRPDDSKAMFEEALGITAKREETRSLAAAHCHLYIGNCLRGMDRLGEAIAHYELCLGIHTEKQGVDSTHRAQALRALGYAYYQENRVDVAIATFADAVRVTRLSTKDDGRALAHCLNNLASIEMDAGLSQDSRKHFDEALSLYIRVHGEMHPEVARTMKRICDLLNQEGHYDEAIRIQTRATKIQRQIFGSDHEEYADSIQSIACFYSNKGHLSKAMDLFNQALCIHTKNGVENCRVALCHINMAKTQERRGDHKGALASAKEAVRISSKLMTVSSEHEECCGRKSTKVLQFIRKKHFDDSEE